MKLSTVLFSLVALSLSSCINSKRLCRNNQLYVYKNNGQQLVPDQVTKFTVKKPFQIKVTDKTTYYQIAAANKLSDKDLIDKGYLHVDSTVAVIKPDGTFPQDLEKLPIKGFYFPETKYFMADRPLKFWDGNWGIQAMTIPLKFRPVVHNDSLYPSNVEAGFNANIATGYRLNLNLYNPFATNKFMNRPLNQYSLTTGFLLGIGATALKKAVNAPGLNTADRSSPSFSYGAYCLFGLNNISIGYAVGFDNVTDGGSKYWIYQNKLWQGLIVSIDLLKF